MLHRKYLHKKVLSKATGGPSCSHFWQGPMKVNHTFQQFVKMVLENGEKTLFWIDGWVNNSPLSTVFPFLYNLFFRGIKSLYIHVVGPRTVQKKQAR